MADTDQLLKAIESIKKDMATKADVQRVEQAQAAQDSSILRLEKEQGQISDTVKRLEKGQAETKASLAQNTTILEAVAAGQKELQETVATKAEVLSVGVKVDKLRKRIEGIEEHTHTDNPTKN